MLDVSNIGRKMHTLIIYLFFLLLKMRLLVRVQGMGEEMMQVEYICFI